MESLVTSARTDRRGFVPCPPALSRTSSAVVSTNPGAIVRPEFRDGHLIGARVYRPTGARVSLRRVRVWWTGGTANGA